MKVGGRPVDFMVDTGAQHSAGTRPVGPVSRTQATNVGATGHQIRRPFLLPRRCSLGGHGVIREFLYLPDCPVALMGRDLLGERQAHITFNSQGRAALILQKPDAKIGTLTIPQGEEWRVYSLKGKPPLVPELPLKVPGVWAEENPAGLARNIPPVVVELKPGAEPTRQRQYFIPRKAQVGIQKHLERRFEYGMLRPCQSPWKAPRLPVPKPGTDDERPVQDLRAVNQVTVTIHPAVPSPYSLSGLIPAEATFFTCLDLKDAFFCIRLAPQSPLTFAFQWEDPQNGDRGQLTWTRLPQGFKNSPTTFGTALASDLDAFPAHQYDCVPLQHVDDSL